VKAQKQADKLAAKDAAKKQFKVPKHQEKKSLIVILLYKKTSISPPKRVTFSKDIEVMIEEEGSHMVATRTRQINLPARFKQ
jgi:hypothetical protein